MAVPFYLPEGGVDETASGSPPPSTSTSSSQSSSGASTSSLSPAGTSSASSGGSSSVASQSPNTTTSATQTPMQSPLLTSEHLMMAICEVVQRYASQNAPPIFQYPPPPSPSCSVPSPSYNGGEFFFPRGRSTPRTPRTTVSFAAGEEANFYRQRSTVPQPIPQSAPPLHHSYQPQQTSHFHPHSSSTFAAHYAQYTPPPTPTTNPSAPLGSNTHAQQLDATGFNNGATASSSTQTAMRLHRSHSDAARRSRLTSTGEDEREYQSDHETSWDEFEDRFENFTAGRERLQEFNGRIPPRKKKNKEPIVKAKPDKKEQSFTWPTVVTVFVVAMGCGFLVAR